MLLALDLGNTNLTIGLYEETRLAWHWRLAADPARTPDEYGLLAARPAHPCRAPRPPR